MGQYEVRPCRREDLPAVVDLLLAGGDVTPGVTAHQIHDYAASVYFENPWARDDMPSLVTVDANGRLEGFVGVVPRRMKLGEEVIDAVVPGNFVVRASPDGTVNAFAALAMLKRLFSGPQTITVTDTANEASRRLWEAAGAINPGLQSLEWFRPIKPATALLQIMETARGTPLPLSRVIYAGTRSVDLLAAPVLARMARNKDVPFSLEPFDEAFVLQILNGRERRPAVVGCYEPECLDWLLSMVASKAAGRTLRQSVVVDGQGARAGAYIYVLSPGGIAQVLLHAAKEGRFDLVLQAIIADAAKLGASLVTGAVQPRQLPAYKGQRSFMMCNQFTLVHSRRQDVLDTFYRGRSRLTALDGERWTRFGDLFSI